LSRCLHRRIQTGGFPRWLLSTEGLFLWQLGSSRSAALRAGLRQSGRNLFLLFPALIPQRASAPGKRTGLLSVVPLSGTGFRQGTTYRAKTE